VRDWLRTQQMALASVLDVDLHHCRKQVYDISVNATGPAALDGDQAMATRRLFDELAAADAAVGVGRYRENRSCYQGEQFLVSGEARTMHMGIDLFVPAGDAIYAPLAGVVHSFADNAKPYDYGPTILLHHAPAPGVSFFTLYGHLGRASLDGLAVGQCIKAGQQLGWIGDLDVNGGWIPHLHFQIILDMLDGNGDFPAVCKLSQTRVWQSLCPNPNLLLGMSEAVSVPMPAAASTALSAG